MRLKDRVVIVTGGGSGIGRAIALLFGKEGAKVVVVGRRQEPLNETVREIEKAGGIGWVLVGDVSNSSDVNSIVQKVVSQFKHLDILVNNAGIYLANDVVSAREEEWDKVFSIDLKGVWFFSKASMPHMIKAGSGKIINVASIAGLVGFGQSAAYCAAKGAVINLTREMALDYGSKHINVNAIAPGVIETDMTKAFLENEEEKKNLLFKTPIGRVGKPEDIAYAALYLASSESDFVTGHTLVVDGGWLAS